MRGEKGPTPEPDVSPILMLYHKRKCCSLIGLHWTTNHVKFWVMLRLFFSSGFLSLIQCDTLKQMDFYKLKVVLFSFQASWTDVKKTASQGLR